MIGDQTVLAYSMTERTIVLYVARRVSFCLPQDVEVRALRILIEEYAISLVILVCSPKLRLGSSVSPRIFELLMAGIATLLMVRFSVILCSWVSGVKSIAVDLLGFSIRSLFFVQSKMSWRHGWRSCSAM